MPHGVGGPALWGANLPHPLLTRLLEPGSLAFSTLFF